MVVGAAVTEAVWFAGAAVAVGCCGMVVGAASCVVVVAVSPLAVVSGSSSASSKVLASTMTPMTMPMTTSKTPRNKRNIRVSFLLTLP